MVRQTLSALAVGVSGGLLALSGTPAQADGPSEGIVRITDCESRSDQIQAGTAGAPCPTNTCPDHGGRNCRGNGTGHVRGILSILHPHGAGLHSADHGWAPPGRVQLPYRRPVAYQKWFPDQWTGQPTPFVVGGPRPPVVYMPTDTTQLGYYYQVVPRWHAYGGMIPSAPNPSDFHHDLCQLRGTTGISGEYGAPVCPNGSGNVQPTPADVPPGAGIETAPVVPQMPAAAVPQAGSLEKSAQAPALVPVGK